MNIRKMAKIQAKDIQLNVIRLCFQAYLMDQSGKFTNLLPPVCSNPIFDSSGSSFPVGVRSFVSIIVAWLNAYSRTSLS